MAESCASCGREIEVCVICEREDCPESRCYRCVVIDLREFVPHPHAHGG
ncbi:MAG TPA: hypothetical protein VE962_08395 [Actinomycetota bacterium]|nr:hypothetical protein [Actinomycetota bacterium]